MVTATKVFSSLTSYGDLPLFAVMNLRFVPEPGTLLLFGVGVAGLAVARRRSLH